MIRCRICQMDNYTNHPCYYMSMSLHEVYWDSSIYTVWKKYWTNLVWEFFTRRESVHLVFEPTGANRHCGLLGVTVCLSRHQNSDLTRMFLTPGGLPQGPLQCVNNVHCSVYPVYALAGTGIGSGLSRQNKTFILVYWEVLIHHHNIFLFRVY